MKEEHTKGPWVALPEECDKPYIRIRGTQLGLRYKIANVITLTYDGVNPREAEETRANARLISAAPELLDALKRLSSSLLKKAEGVERPNALVQALAVIMKVEGDAS